MQQSLILIAVRMLLSEERNQVQQVEVDSKTIINRGVKRKKNKRNKKALMSERYSSIAEDVKALSALYEENGNWPEPTSKCYAFKPVFEILLGSEQL